MFSVQQSSRRDHNRIRTLLISIAPLLAVLALSRPLSLCAQSAPPASPISAQLFSFDSAPSGEALHPAARFIWQQPEPSQPTVGAPIAANLSATPSSDFASSSELPDAPYSFSAEASPQTQQSPGPPSSTSASQSTPKPCANPPCSNTSWNWYHTFVNGPRAVALTPEQKGWLALRNLVDPFNLITILGEAGIVVASDPHSDYGPGMPGFGRYVGVSFTQDLTGEFFNTFLIPSLVHQDPRYHRMPHASYFRRSIHAVTQVVWTQGDDQRGMWNYANLAGFAIDDEISNLYVPGRETNASATAQRYAIGLATAPISNFITEFLPDVASHIHVEVVIVQRIINQVAKNESSGQ
jgi:hypothetical protein